MKTRYCFEYFMFLLRILCLSIESIFRYRELDKVFSFLLQKELWQTEMTKGVFGNTMSAFTTKFKECQKIALPDQNSNAFAVISSIK